VGMETRDNVVVCVCIYIGWDYYSDDFAHNVDCYRSCIARCVMTYLHVPFHFSNYGSFFFLCEFVRVIRRDNIQ
jgi:hypothetical protein